MTSVNWANIGLNGAVQAMMHAYPGLQTAFGPFVDPSPQNAWCNDLEWVKLTRTHDLKGQFSTRISLMFGTKESVVFSTAFPHITESVTLHQESVTALAGIYRFDPSSFAHEIALVRGIGPYAGATMTYYDSVRPREAGILLPNGQPPLGLHAMKGSSAPVPLNDKLLIDNPLSVAVSAIEITLQDPEPTSPTEDLEFANTQHGLLLTKAKFITWLLDIFVKAELMTGVTMVELYRGLASGETSGFGPWVRG